jgi:Mg2+/Co2+ transporter CorB
MGKFHVFLAPLIAVILILMLISAFLSASETALIALNRIRLRNLIAKGNKKAELVGGLVRNLDRLITTILISNNFVNIGISSIATVIFISFFGPRIGVISATLVVTISILIFCEITPKIFASSRAEKVALAVSGPVKWIVKILSPLSNFFSTLSKKIIILFGGRLTKRSPLITEEEIKLMIEVGKEEGILAEKEREMLHRIFAFGDTKVFEVMVPKQKIVAIEIDANQEDLLNLFIEESHSRIPVYNKTLDNIVGVIYVRDLVKIFKKDKPIKMSDLIHQPFFCEPERRVIDLLRDFQKKRMHIAIVKQNGETKGLVTLEDLLEEIVGEIEDEYESNMQEKL